jgi:ABC-2 type transport system permease protein
MKPLTDSWHLTVRNLTHLLRQPWFVALTLVQPVIWLVLYGQLFQRVVELPGFKSHSYLDFLTPGIVVMSALFSSGWTGMGIINDINAGVMDRFLVSPASRAAIIISRLMTQAIITLVQSLILFSLGALMGARYEGGVLGLAILLIAAILLGLPFAALSTALALALRKEESVIGAVNFVLLPLTFLSPLFMAEALMPPWIRTVARFNPVNWSVAAGRSALSGSYDWAFILSRLILLAAFALVCGWIATSAFRSYRRSA